MGNMTDAEFASARAFVVANRETKDRDLLAALMGAGVGCLDAVYVLYAVVSV